MNQMNLAFVVLISAFSFNSFAADTPAAAAAAAKPKYGPQATRLIDSPAYVKKHDAPDYWALNSYYVSQITEGSCSVAAGVMVLNALRAHKKLGASDELFTQKGIFDKPSFDDWTKATHTGGHGVDLDQFGMIMSRAFDVYGMKGMSIETIHADGTKPNMKRIHDALVANEKSDHDFIIANFLQSEYTGDPEGAIGHLAPVAAYDAATKRVLIMDPDRTYYEPYWVSEETFMKGLATTDSSVKQSRGIVWIKRNP
jgi:hypothetical protein